MLGLIALWLFLGGVNFFLGLDGSSAASAALRLTLGRDLRLEDISTGFFPPSSNSRDVLDSLLFLVLCGGVGMV
uniref:Uncharacterized protein n=1 Tax=Anguilla anguilla TaxID=7936 RepID=A0A0E9QEZ2_ANGAN